MTTNSHPDEDIIQITTTDSTYGAYHYTSAIRGIEWMNEWLFVRPGIKVLRKQELESHVQLPASNIRLPQNMLYTNTTKSEGFLGYSYSHKINVNELEKTNERHKDLRTLEYNSPCPLYFQIACDPLDLIVCGFLSKEVKYAYYDVVHVNSGKSYILIDNLPNPDAYLHSIVNRPMSYKPTKINCCCICCPTFSQIDFSKVDQMGIHSVLRADFDTSGCCVFKGQKSRDVAFLDDQTEEGRSRVKPVVMVFSQEDAAGAEKVKRFIAAIAQSQHRATACLFRGDWEKPQAEKENFMIYKTIRNFSGNFLAQIFTSLSGCPCRIGLCCASCLGGEQMRFSLWHYLKPCLFYSDDSVYKAIDTALGGISGYEVAKISAGAIILVPFEGYGPQSPSTENPMSR